MDNDSAPGQVPYVTTRKAPGGLGFQAMKGGKGRYYGGKKSAKPKKQMKPKMPMKRKRG